MTKPTSFDRKVFCRVTQDTYDALERLRTDERQGDFMRRVLADALADLDAGRWMLTTPPYEPKVKRAPRKKKASPPPDA